MSFQLSDARGLRGALSSIVPNWLSNRRGLNTGFKVLWVIALICDVFIQIVLDGVRAAWPGRGTPSALGAIGLSRGIVRGFGDSETDAHYAARLLAWRTTWQTAGSQEAIITQSHEYLVNQTVDPGARPLIRIVDRAGTWTTIAADGTVTTATQAWDWDSVSNPERAGYWSDQWVIVYRDPWAYRGAWGSGTWGADTLGFGHQNSRQEYGDLRSILATWKGAHSNIRAVIFTTSSTLFDPANPASLPDGTWGDWGLPNNNGPRFVGGRNTTVCRYWEPGIED